MMVKRFIWLQLSDIADLSIFGIGVASNGGGSSGIDQELPVMSISAGDDVLLARSSDAMSLYLEDCYAEFEHVLQGRVIYFTKWR